MTLHWWLGFSALVAVVGFVIFTFRPGFKVKPDPNNRKADGMPPGSIGMDGPG